MDVFGEIYYGILDAYNTIYPWIPLQIRASLQSLLTQSWLLVRVLLTNPSELQYMIPTIASTLALAISVYWTITTVYHSVRRGLRVIYLLVKYGTMIAFALGILGWMNPVDPNKDLTVPGAIESGWHVFMSLFDELPRARPAPPKRKGPGMPWEKFSPREDRSPNSRHKPRKPKSHSRSSTTKSASSQQGSSGSATNPFADFGIADALGWLLTLRQSGSGGENGEREESEFAHKLREVWQRNRDAWEKVKLDAFAPRPSNEEDIMGTDDAELENEDGRSQTELR
jgi:hypothetical protein